jgi:hypothetical protein
LTIVVLLILAVVWAAVLVPPWLRSRADARPADSISAFRHRLTVLERTGPVGARRVPLVASRPDVAGFVPVAGRPVSRAALSPVGARARTQRRRRDIFVGMLAAMLTSLVIGFVPALRILWVVHVLVDFMFVTYVALLVHMRNQAAERDMKVRFLPGRLPGRPEPATLLLRRSAH